MSLLGTVIDNLAIILTVFGVGFGFVAGFAVIPVVARMPGVNVPGPFQEPLARVLIAVAGVTRGRWVLDWAAESGYAFRGVVHRDELPDDVDAPLETTDAEWWFSRDGAWTPIEHGTSNWQRFGLVPFGITFDPDDAYPDPSEATADGGREFVERGGDRLGILSPGGGDGIRVPLGPLHKRLEEAAGIAISEAAKDVALKEWGQGGQTEEKWLILGMVFALLSGVACGYLVMVM